MFTRPPQSRQADRRIPHMGKGPKGLPDFCSAGVVFHGPRHQAPQQARRRLLQRALQRSHPVSAPTCGSLSLDRTFRSCSTKGPSFSEVASSCAVPAVTWTSWHASSHIHYSRPKNLAVCGTHLPGFDQHGGVCIHHLLGEMRNGGYVPSNANGANDAQSVP